MSISFSEPDQYGQAHPIETPALITGKMKELDVELAKIKKKDAYDQAKIKCSDQLTDNFKLMFLRCEVFNADLAAMRLVNYWEKRLELFGPDRAFLPLTQDSAFKDDAIALSLGIFQVIPAKDSSGRSIIMGNPAKQDKSKCPRESMARATWYLIHSILENEEAQKKGIVVLMYPKNAKLSNFDRGLAKMNTDSMKGCLPIRLSALHVCQPPSFFQVIFPIIKLFMGERLRQRIRVHFGSQEDVLKKLQSFGLTVDQLPTELGGNLALDHETYLADRKANGK